MKKTNIVKEINKRIENVKPSTWKFIGVCAKSAAFGLVKGMTMSVAAGVTYNYMKDNGRSEFASTATAATIALGTSMVMDHAFEDLISEELEKCSEMYVHEITEDAHSKFATDDPVCQATSDFSQVVKQDLDEISKMTGGTMAKDDLSPEAKAAMDRIDKEAAEFEAKHQEINHELDKMSDDLGKLGQD